MATTLTDQQFFDDTIAFILQQERQAAVPNPNYNPDGPDDPLVDTENPVFCLYRSPHGPCAIGRLIPDGHPALAEADEQGWQVGGILARFPNLAGVAWPDTHSGVQLAAKLQSLHDTTYYRDRHPDGGYGRVTNVTDFLADAQQVANDFGLAWNTPAVTS